MNIRDELKERLWIPGLVANHAKEEVISLVSRRKTEYKRLDMDKSPECGVLVDLQGQRLLRPHLIRDSFFSLDGVWELADSSAEKIPPKQAFSLSCTVPYAPQSSLSQFDASSIGDVFWYKKTFSLPEHFRREKSDRILLHFGAADQMAEVYVNGCFAVKHEGGYLPFEADITEQLFGAENSAAPNKETHEICVRITDSIDTDYPYGKQSKKRGGMWYTPVSGIWQSVWLEAVPQSHISQVKCIAQNSGEAELHITVHQAAEAQDGENAQEWQAGIRRMKLGAEVLVPQKDYTVTDFRWETQTGADRSLRIRFKMETPMLWSPETPHLYEVQLSLGTDEIETYFAFRQVRIEEVNHRARITLNGVPIFLQGVLDQGYFSDGIYTPNSPLWYLDDILHMKELGFNTLRKHIKIEPECFYYFCDIYGMLVMQDMVNSGAYSFARNTVLPTLVPLRSDTRKNAANKKQKEFFIRHCEETLKHLYHHPSICYYTIFNEGWGQFESDRVYDILKKQDKTRLFDSTSGWFMQKESDVYSSHTYYHRFHMPLRTARPVILSECGGYSYKLPAHCFNQTDRYGYGDCESEKHLTDRICHLYEKEIIPAIPKGLCGCIYTQLSDVEDETNGFYTYDRKCCKVEKQRIRRVNQKLFHVFEVAVRL